MKMKALMRLSVVVGLLVVASHTSYAAEDCSVLESRQRVVCEIKGLKESPPDIFNEACGLWFRLGAIDSVLNELKRFEIPSGAEEVGISEGDVLRLRDEAADQFAAYAIGIMQMPREARRYKTCDTGKAQFSWADGYEVAAKVAETGAHVNRSVLRSVLIADVDRQLQELRTVMSEGLIPAKQVLPCIASLLDGVNRFGLVLTIAQWGSEDNAAVDQYRGGDYVCFPEVSIRLRPQ